MARAKTKRSTTRAAVAIPADVPTYEAHPSASMMQSPVESKKRVGVWMLLLVLVVLGVFLVKNKGLFVVALVNNKPIFRWDVNSVMFARFGKQTAESMIGETLIGDAAAKAGVVVTPADVQAKEQEILKGFGGQVTIDDFLRIQGVSKDEFDRQVHLQLLVQKALGKDITIADGDIDAFIATNRALLVATEPAAIKEEARQAIFDQKVGEKFSTWFAQLKDRATVVRFY